MPGHVAIKWVVLKANRIVLVAECLGVHGQLADRLRGCRYEDEGEEWDEFQTHLINL